MHIIKSNRYRYRNRYRNWTKNQFELATTHDHAYHHHHHQQPPTTTTNNNRRQSNRQPIELLRHQTNIDTFIEQIDKFQIQEITEIDQIYRVLKQAGELKSGQHLTAADKSVHVPGTKGLDGSAGLGVGSAVGAGPPSLALPLQSVSAGGERAPPPEIPIVNVPDTGFHLDSHQQQQREREREQQQQHTHQRSLASVAQAAAVRAGRGVRPPPVAMPILGVQLQQQELQQQRGGLPVPTQDISSSSGPQLQQ